MKKIFIFAVFAVTVILSAGSAFASEYIKPLSDIGIFDSQVHESQKVTVEELCKVASKLISEEDVVSDDEENPLGGYVENMIGSGLISEDTDVKAYADGETVSKLFLFALGYSQIAESTDFTYTAAAQHTGILWGSGITQAGEVTYGMLSRAVMNVLTEELATISLSKDGAITIDMSVKNGTVLSNIYGISAYEAVVNSVDEASKSVKAEIKRNLFDENKVILSEGKSVMFRLSDKVSPYILDNTPSVIWVKDETIVSAYLKKGTEIRFEVVSSVNGDTKTASGYSSSNIKKIRFYDDKKEYKTSADFKIRYNGAILGKYQPVKAAGRYVRAVILNSEVVFMEVWDFDNSAIVKEVLETEISLINGSDSAAKLKKLDRYDFVKVIINGNYSNLGSIKPNSVLSWSEYNGGIAIAVNEQVISAEFKEISNDTLRIGDMYYKKSPSLYASKDGIKFNSDSDTLFACLGNDVSAYFNVKKELCYIGPVKGASFASSTFIGTVTGIRTDSFLGITEMEILSLEGNFEKKVYTLKEKARFYDGITVSDITQAAALEDGSAIYEFSVSPSGEVSQIKKPCEFEGFGSSVITFTTFNTDTSYASISYNGIQYYLGNTPFIVVYRNSDGELTAAKTSWTNLYSKNAAGINFHLIGYEDSTDMKMIIMTGKTENISYSESRYGVLKDKYISLDEHGEPCYTVTILSNQSESEYTIPYDEGVSLPERAYVTYLIGFSYDSQRTVKINSVTDLTGNFDEWPLDSFKNDVVTRKGERSFMTETGGLTSLHPYYCFVAVLEDGEITKGDMSDISVGDRIYYYVQSNTTRIIFVSK